MTMPVFNTDSITIVRKKWDFHVRQDIPTIPFLPDLGITCEEYRANVVKRLRRDPSVILVLEPHDGVCEERADLPGGYTLTIRIVEVPSDAQSFDKESKPVETACVALICEGEVVCREDYKAEKSDYGGQKMLEDVIGYIAETLDLIEAGKYECVGGSIKNSKLKI